MYKRVLLKLSGESLKGDSPLILDSGFVDGVARMLASLNKKGIQSCI